MRRLFLDFETYSDADLTTVGGPVYAADPSTEGLMVAWALDDGDVEQADLFDRAPLPPRLLALLEAPDVMVHAHNAKFEWLILRHVYRLELPLERVYCDMVHAQSLALPASLGELGSVIGLGEDVAKMKEGKRLIRVFCQPRKPTKNMPWTRNTPATKPDDWSLFLEYNVRDVVAERAVYNKLKNYPMPAEEWALWRLDQKVNGTGYPIDVPLVENAIAQADDAMATAMAEARELTGLDNPNAVGQLRGWLERQGCPVGNLQKATVESLLEQGLPADVRRVLVLRQSTGKASIKKYYSLKAATSADDRLRDCLVFYGASRTGRWSGRRFQPQNITRGNISDPVKLRSEVEHVRQGGTATLELLSDLIRCAIRAPDGQLVRVSDLANIESRILGWIAYEPTMLGVFASGADIYKDFGTELLRKPAEEITKPERNYCKPPALGCGYGLGAKGLVAYADGMGVEMSETNAQEAVDVFRSRYDRVPALWKRLEAATILAITERRSVKCGRVSFDCDGRFLFMYLPSGRRLAYYKPRVEDQVTPWGETRPSVTYEGLDQYTRKWSRLNTFGGKWTEQICQAISRDLLAHGMQLADEVGFELVGHTHDELISLTDADDWRDHDVLSWCMYQSPPWADDQLYLDAEGFSDVIYRKD